MIDWKDAAAMHLAAAVFPMLGVDTASSVVASDACDLADALAVERCRRDGHRWVNEGKQCERCGEKRDR